MPGNLRNKWAPKSEMNHRGVSCPGDNCGDLFIGGQSCFEGLGHRFELVAP
jgi:hypothetical protein